MVSKCNNVKASIEAIDAKIAKLIFRKGELEKQLLTLQQGSEKRVEHPTLTARAVEVVPTTCSVEEVSEPFEAEVSDALSEARALYVKHAELVDKSDFVYSVPENLFSRLTSEDKAALRADGFFFPDTQP